MLIVGTILLLGACAGMGPRVVASYDPATDFSQFKTFGFVQPLGTDNRSGRTALSMQLVAATTRELQSRGLQSVGNSPDLTINFFVQETSGVATSNMSVASSPFVHAHGGATTWSGYDLRTSSARRITEGSIALDIFDARRNMLVFEGFAEDRVTEEMRDRLDETVSNAVAGIFENFP